MNEITLLAHLNLNQLNQYQCEYTPPQPNGGFGLHLYYYPGYSPKYVKVELDGTTITEIQPKSPESESEYETEMQNAREVVKLIRAYNNAINPQF